MEAVKVERKEEGDEESLTEVLTWRSSLPTTVLRVLLVEADDSTRQIITALLRKCNYKVVSVSDGLRAWETIKAKHSKIDLILTEAELPSISGFALLSIVMEHDMCKNIPVIVMSSQDSVNLVLKCMQKGAADYLIKPVRRNELRNLWQHVWRRDSQRGGQTPDNLTVSQQKFEATAENNLASNHLNDNTACIRKTMGLSEKPSDAQNSCTTPNLEAESTCVQNMQDISQLKYGTASNLSNTDIEMFQDCDILDKKYVARESETKESSGTFGSDILPLDEALNSVASRLIEEHITANTTVQDEGLRAEVCKEKDDKLVQPFCGVRDLLCTFDNWPTSNFGITTGKDDGRKHFGLELSLRSLDSSQKEVDEEMPSLNHSDASAFSRSLDSSQKEVDEEMPSLNHSVASAFSRYSNSTGLHTIFSTLPRTNSVNKSNFDSRQVNLVNFTADHTEQGPQLAALPVTGDTMRDGFGHYNSPLCVEQSSLARILGTKSTNQSTQSHIHSTKGYDQSNKNTEKSTDQTLLDRSNPENILECLKPGSPAAASQSGCSSLGNGAVDNHINGSISSSNDGKASSARTCEMAMTSGSLNDSGFGVDSLRASQREAALIKFRLKRKDRCFEKKVRYQSRKLLAEKRARVKGQFVHNSSGFCNCQCR